MLQVWCGQGGGEGLPRGDGLSATPFLLLIALPMIIEVINMTLSLEIC